MQRHEIHTHAITDAAAVLVARARILVSLTKNTRQNYSELSIMCL